MAVYVGSCVSGSDVCTRVCIRCGIRYYADEHVREKLRIRYSNGNRGLIHIRASVREWL